MNLIDWDCDAPATEASLVGIVHFDARGMKPVYGRGDFFPSPYRNSRGILLNMDVWLRVDGRIFARFWSRGSDVDWESYEIVGVDPATIPQRGPDELFTDSWIPQSLRDAFEGWVTENL